MNFYTALYLILVLFSTQEIFTNLIGCEGHLISPISVSTQCLNQGRTELGVNAMPVTAQPDICIEDYSLMVNVKDEKGDPLTNSAVILHLDNEINFISYFFIMKIWDLPTTEKDAIEFLQDRGLLHKTRVCRDGHEMKLYHKQRPVWECRRCRQQQGVRSGNWFSNTKLSFVTIVRFIYCWAKEIEEAGFEHFKVNHKYNFVDPETGCNTQKVERMWGSAKWRNKKHRGTARHHLESYFAEFMWRKMIGDGDVFEEIILAWGKYWALD